MDNEDIAKTEDDLMKFTNYIYDLSSANFKEENLFFNDNSHLKNEYTNRMMSSKIKDFEEIQSKTHSSFTLKYQLDEFNNANYVYNKQKTEQLKINEDEFDETEEKKKNYKKFIEKHKQFAEIADKARKLFYFGEKGVDPTKNLSYKNLNVRT